MKIFGMLPILLFVFNPAGSVADCDAPQAGIIPARPPLPKTIHSFLYSGEAVASALADLAVTDADSVVGVNHFPGFSSADGNYSCDAGKWANPIARSGDAFSGDWTMDCRVKSSGKGFAGMQNFINTRVSHEGKLLEGPNSLQFRGSPATHYALNLPVNGAGGNISLTEDIYFGQKSPTEFFASHFSRDVEGDGAAIFLKKINNGLTITKNPDQTYSLKFTSHIEMANPWFVEPKEIFTAAAQNSMNRNCTQQVKDLIPLLHDNL